jgi:Rrf2 family iron-sulfur cluster assembly transcriptional regulator
MAILEVANCERTLPLKLADIATRQSIPVNYLEQIFSMLKNAGIVQSVKGPGGGYRLNKNLDDLFIVEIIDAVEESTKMTRCTGHETCLTENIKCNAHYLWHGLENNIRNYLSNISVSDVLSQKEF